MKKISAVIFDMDGVICHTNPFHSLAFQSFFAKRQMFPTKEEFKAHMYGKSNRYIFSHFFQREISDSELVELENEKESLFREIYAPHIETIPEFLPFLESIKSAGLKTGVATSAPRANLDLIVSHLQIAPHMESMMASEHVTHHKPHPEVYVTSADRLGVDPSTCVVFEDSFSGVTAGLAAGMRVVGVLSSHSREELPPCHAYIENYSEITVSDLQQLP